MAPAKVCWYFRENRCLRGTQCKFSHDIGAGTFITKQAKAHTQACNHQRTVPVSGLQEEWKDLLRQRCLPAWHRSKHADERFFKLALELMEGDVGASQETIRKLATEDGLAFLRDLADRCRICETGPADISDADLWENRVQPMFKLITHRRVTDSAVLEQDVAVIYNFLIGVSGSRMAPLFAFVTRLVKAWEEMPSSPTGSRIEAVELSLCALVHLVDCNATNIVNANFASVIEPFHALITQMPHATAGDKFFRRQAEKYLDYIQRRLGLGDAIPIAQGAAPGHAVNRTEFVIRRDLPGELCREGPRHDNDHEDITKIQIMPTQREILSPRGEYLPTNDSRHFHRPGIEGRLDREFRLLREDTVGQLRDAIRAQVEAMGEPSPNRPARSNPAEKQKGLHMYTYYGPIVNEIDFDKHNGLELLVRFSQPMAHNKNEQRERWWARSKRLQPDALVCVLSAAGSVLFFVVSRSTIRVAGVDRQNKRENTATPSSSEPETKPSLAGDARFSYVKLRPVNAASVTLTDILNWYRGPGSQQSRWLIEFPGVLLPSFQYTLESLQKMSKQPRLPFVNLIAPENSHSGRTVDVLPPTYATNPAFAFNLACITNDGGPLFFSPLDEYNHLQPDQLSKRTSLDPTQAAALLNTLSRALSLVQGPPGTGKSFTGEKVIKVILANKAGNRLGPVLCVCYTNHALDQLLEHLHEDGTKNIIRIGSRSKSEKLSDMGLRSVAKRSERTRFEGYALWQSETWLAEHQKRMVKQLDGFQFSNSWASLKQHLQRFHQRHYDELFGDEVDEEGFEKVQWKPKERAQTWLRQGQKDDSPPRAMGDLLEADLDGMTYAERQILHQHWLREIQEPLLTRITNGHEAYEQDRKARDRVHSDIDLRCLQEADVIGVTTTGLARNLDLLNKVRCKVMLCEEAGEVLESHTLTALLPSVEHAILIGDHLQLRPQITNHELHSTNPRGAQFSLDVSLFERLVSPPHPHDLQLPFSTLDTQRRMHPSISRLIRATLYPGLEDCPEVAEYPEVAGMRRRLFWLHHEQPEDAVRRAKDVDLVTTTSHTNEFEVEMTTALVTHLVRQGVYTSGDIAVLTPYLGQLHGLRSRMSNLFEIALNERDSEDLEGLEAHAADQAPELAASTHKNNNASSSPPSRNNGSTTTMTALLESVRVATVDNFQGEEAKVVIISLVRSNPEQKCGFLSTSNRINVLLSRAQHGMYIIGNSATCARVRMWADVQDILRAEDNMGDELPLQCPRHPDTLIGVSQPDHFLQFSPEGGCNQPCDRRLDCGHMCISRCHGSALHAVVKCLESCVRSQAGCDHPCLRVCGDPCPSRCGLMLEGIDLALPCGHSVSSAPCWQVQNPSTIQCQVTVAKKIPGCNHSVEVPCDVDVGSDSYSCIAPCGSPLLCGHTCTKACNQCRERRDGATAREDHGTCWQVCGRDYAACQHRCKSTCHAQAETPCPPCPAPCEVRCSHSRCSKACHEPCVPCAEPVCASRCPHSACTMPCAAPCGWVPCSRRCELELDCGHRCPSVCGEACPEVKYCQVCCTEDMAETVVDFILAMVYRDINLDDDPCIFPDCGHFVTRSSMDGVMDMGTQYECDETTGEPLAILGGGASRPFSLDEIKLCPICRGSLRNIPRYGRIVRRAMIDEATKKFIGWSGAECVKLSLRLVDEQDRLKDMQPSARPVGQTSFLAKSSTPTSALALIRMLPGGQQRYKGILKLHHDITVFKDRVRREEQPLQRVVDLVRHARRQAEIKKAEAKMETETQAETRGGSTAINSSAALGDESLLAHQSGSFLQASALLLNCESLIFVDYMRVRGTLNSAVRGARREWVAEKQDQGEDERIGEGNMDVAAQMRACEDLVRLARSKGYPRQEVEGLIYHARFCAVAVFFSPPAGHEHETLKTAGLAYLASARAVIVIKPSTSKLAPAIDAAELLLNEGVFSTAVSADEMRAVYAAMAAEFSGTGHWYTCERGHPFTVGECGMPIERARCPECGAAVGGLNHVPDQGVRAMTVVGCWM